MSKLAFLWRLVVAAGILKETIGKAFIQTKDQVAANIDINRESLLLQVKGCSDLYVKLRVKESGKEADIGIGINQNNGISVKTCSICQETYGPQLEYLDCTAFKPFWITWTGQTVKMGRGHDVGMDEILSSYFANSDKVNLLRLAGKANWIIETDDMKCSRHLYQRTLESMIDGLDVFHSFAAADIFYCIKACHEIQGCDSINYNKEDGSCELFAALPGDGDFKVKANWQSWIVVA